MGNTLPVPTATVIITVLDANDNSPMFTDDEYSFNVRENMPAGTSVGTVLANDLDAGENAKVGGPLFRMPCVCTRLECL